MHSAGGPTRCTARGDGGVRVELVYAEPAREILIGFDVDRGATVLDCVVRSGLFALMPGLRDAPLGFAVFGRRVEPEATVSEGDRIEVLRALVVDPREARRRRARRGAPGTGRQVRRP